MEYTVLSKSKVDIVVVEYRLTDNTIQIITVPVFDAYTDEEVDRQIQYRGSLIEQSGS